MALEMQFLPLMKSVMGAILSLVLATSLKAAAEESACVKMYREADSEFQAKYEKLGQQKWEKGGMAAVGGAGGAACAWVMRRSPAGLVGCAAFTGIVGGPALGSSMMVGSRQQALYDSHLLFQAYEDFQKNPEAASDAGQIIASDLGAEESDVTEVIEEIVTMMEEGTICDKRKPSSYEDTLALLSKRLSEI